MHASEVCIVTGANRGLGLATAEGLARDGATVVLACRDAHRGFEAEATVRAAAQHDRVHFLSCDLADPHSVDSFVHTFSQQFDRLDVFVGNAGVTLPDLHRSALDVEVGWHVGYLGHYQLLRRLLPTLQASSPARIVLLAGLYHQRGQLTLDDLGWAHRPWDWAQAGSNSQLAKVLLAYELADRLAGTGVTVAAVHPGAVRTHTQDVLPWHLRLLADTVLRPAFVSPRRGARTVLRLAEDEALEDGRGYWFRRYHEAEPHPMAHDAAARRALWNVSADLLGLPHDG